MNTQTITIAPVKKSVVVKAPQEKAFKVFTAGLDRWWPKNHHIGASPLKLYIVEPRTGGRWYGQHEDGSETTVGHMLAWEPPSRVVFTWEIGPDWKTSPNVYSEVEVRFVAEGPNSTRVELEHRNFEALGQQGGEKMRGDVNGGWPAILELYKTEAER